MGLVSGPGLRVSEVPSAPWVFLAEGSVWCLCGALRCGSSGMGHAIPPHVFQGLKSRRWGCNVLGALRKVGSPGLHATVGVCGAWGELLCSLVGLRMVPTIPGVRQACARQACCVAGRGRGARVGNQRLGERYQERKHSASKEAARDCRVSGRFRRCVVAVSYSPTTHRLQYHRRCRA